MERTDAAVLEKGAPMELHDIPSVAFAAFFTCMLVVFGVRCMICIPSILSDLVKGFKRLDALSEEYVAMDLSMFKKQLQQLEKDHSTSVPQKFRFRQSFSTFAKTGLAVWQASISLTIALLQAERKGFDALKEIPKLISGARVAELGTGLGVLSILFAGLFNPAVVVATDGDPDAVKAAGDNVQLNLGPSSRVFVQRLRWGDAKDIKAALRMGLAPPSKKLAKLAVPTRFDLVIGSDITYYPAPLGKLLTTIIDLISPTGTVVIAHKDRAKTTDPQFFREMANYFESSQSLWVEDDTRACQGGGGAGEGAGTHVNIFRGLRSVPEI